MSFYLQSTRVKKASTYNLSCQEEIFQKNGIINMDVRIFSNRDLISQQGVNKCQKIGIL
jgi:hypothetical protein